MTLPKVSVLIPNYNKEQYIARTLISVINQTYNNWECIIVDDRSTDKSFSILLNMAKDDHRIKPLLRKEALSGGGSVCRNIALEEASGEYVMFLDSDDLLSEKCIEERVSEMINNSELDFGVFPMGTFKHQIGDSNYIWNAAGGNYLEKFISHALPWTITSPLWKKDYLKKLGGFDPDYPRLQDVEMHTRALLDKDVRFKIFSDFPPRAFYRIDAKRITYDMVDFLKKWTSGAVMYIEKIGKFIEKDQHRSDKLRKQLKGTVFTTMTNLLHRQSINELNEKNYSQLKDLLLYSIGVKKLFNKKDYYLMNIYSQAYQKGFYKLKGFNYVFKKLIIF